MKNNRQVHLSAVGFASIFGLSFMFSKIALRYIDPMGLIAYRYLIAFIIFEGLRLTKIVKIQFHRSMIKPVLIVSLFQPVLYFIFETNGIARIKSSEAGMMIALIPIMVSLFSIVILKEKPKKIQWPFILMSVLGIIYIQFSNNRLNLSVDFLGYSLMGLAIISAALYNIYSRIASLKVSAITLTYYMMIIGAITFNTIYLIILGIKGNTHTYISNLTNLNILGPILYLGIMASIIAFFLMNYALGKLEAHVTSIYSNLATLMSIVAGVIFLNEKLYLYHYIGSALILIGVYGTVYFSKGVKRFTRKPKKI
ncbi:MAG: DMT family transporter [Candidatus Izemoplasmataceae bacterium]